MTIPAGPWVKSFSTFYRLKYFSCGPSCYSHMKIFTGNDLLYIYVWGDAVDEHVRGVYLLEQKNRKWNKIISGTLDNELSISPNGCQLSYAQSGEMKVTNVCEN